MTYYRCTDCERKGRGFEHRELVNERCKSHALAAIVNHSFVEVTYISDKSEMERRVRGLLYYYERTDTFSIKKFARRDVDSGRHTPEMKAWQLRAIRPVSDREQACDLTPDEPVHIEHFGRVYGGRVIERKRTRVLVRFRGIGNGRVYDRWKHVYAVQLFRLPTTVDA